MHSRAPKRQVVPRKRGHGKNERALLWIVGASGALEELLAAIRLAQHEGSLTEYVPRTPYSVQLVRYNLYGTTTSVLPLVLPSTDRTGQETVGRQAKARREKARCKGCEGCEGIEVGLLRGRVQVGLI